MNDISIKKLCLGTVTFGMSYGIANKRGQINKEEVFRILDYCNKVGINTLDTAAAYGESEKVIGEYLEGKEQGFEVISKLPVLESFENQKITQAFDNSLSNLKSKSIYGYLVHKFDNFSQNEKLWETLENLKRQHLVEKIGFSIYRPKELDFILSKDISFDIIQIPYSVFDTRFAGHFEFLTEKGVEIFASICFSSGFDVFDSG